MAFTRIFATDFKLPLTTRICPSGSNLALARILNMGFKGTLAYRIANLGFILEMAFARNFRVGFINYMARIFKLGYNPFMATRTLSMGFKLNMARICLLDFTPPLAFVYV